MRTTILKLACAAAGLFVTQGAGADGLDRLAPPGPCAEQRAELRGDPEQGFDVAGGPREHFDPKDVAGSGGGDAFLPPEPPAFTRGPCDAPNEACGGAFGRPAGGTGVVIEEPGPTPGGGPVFGGGAVEISLERQSQ